MIRIVFSDIYSLEEKDFSLKNKLSEIFGGANVYQTGYKFFVATHENFDQAYMRLWSTWAFFQKSITKNPQEPGTLFVSPCEPSEWN